MPMLCKPIALLSVQIYNNDLYSKRFMKDKAIANTWMKLKYKNKTAVSKLHSQSVPQYIKSEFVI